MFTDTASVCILQLFPFTVLSHSLFCCLKKKKKKEAKSDKSRGLFTKNDELCAAVINRIYSPRSHQHDLIAMCQNIKQYKCVYFPFCTKCSQAGHIHICLFLAVVIPLEDCNRGRGFFFFFFINILKHCTRTGSGRRKYIFFDYF